MVALRTSLAALFLVLGACDVGEVPSGGGSGGTPDAGAGGVLATEARFNSDIKPMVTTCAVTGCHVGVQVPNFSSFSALEAVYKTSPAATNRLITVKADGSPHQGGTTYFSTAQKMTISKWIENN